MKFLRSGKVPKGEINRVYKAVVDAGVMSLAEVRPLVYEVLIKCVGTQYYSLAALKQMGHPYKKRAPGGLNPGVINVQSGEFFRAFKIEGPTRSGSALTLWVDNYSWKAVLLIDAPRMISRPWNTYLMWNLQRAITPVLGKLLAKNIKLRWKD